MRRVLIMLALAAVVSDCLASAQTLQFSIHLQEHGWEPAKLKMTRGEHEIVETRRIGFDGAGKLYVGFAIEGENKLLKPGEVNNIFRVLTIDQESGAVKRKLDFATKSKMRVGVHVSANDALLLTANDKVQLIGEDGSPKTAFDIPIPAGNHRLSIGESASGKTLLVSVGDLHTHYFLHTDTLSLITRCYSPTDNSEPFFSSIDEPGTFSDNIQMRVEGTTRLGPPYKLVIAPLCGKAEDLWSLGSKVIEPVLVDDSTMLGWAASELDVNTSVFEVRKTNGELVWPEELPKHFSAYVLSLDPVRSTRDGSRFAVEVVELRGGSQRFDRSPRTVSIGVSIYDIHAKKLVGSIKFPKLGRYEFALSPKGDRIAIMSIDGGTLEVWKLSNS